MKKFRIGALLAATALLLSFAGTAFATITGPSVTPIEHSGNITTCPAGYSTVFIDGPGQGTTSDSGNAGGVTVQVWYSNGQTTVAFAATGGVVNIAYIKGGDNYNEYNYGGAGAVADSGLVSPLNGGGNVPTVSHTVFCVTATTTTTSSSTSSSTTQSTSSSTTETSSSTSSSTTQSTSSSTTETTSSTSSQSTTSSATTSGITTLQTTSSSATTAQTPSGSVEGATGSPQLTPPATDAMSSASSQTPSGSWNLLLAAGVVLTLAILVLTPAAKSRRNK